MQFAWLSLAIITTAGYHFVMKVTPAAVRCAFPLSRPRPTRSVRPCSSLASRSRPTGRRCGEGLKPLNWTVLGLAVMVVGLDVGFLMLYRSGFDVSLGQIVTQSGAALILLVAGVALPREKINAANFAGIALCVSGSG